MSIGGAEPAHQGRVFPALFRMALLKGGEASVLLHLRRGTDINARDERGFTPLMIAALAGRMEICRLLLDEGADQSELSTGGLNAAGLAAAAGHQALADLLRPRVQLAIVESARPAGETARRFVLVPDAISEAGSDGWEVDEGFLPASTDEAVANDSRLLQWTFGAARGANTDEAWSDVPAELPTSIKEQDLFPPGEVASFLIEALAFGITSPRSVEGLAARQPGLRSVLEDLGIQESSSFFEEWVSLGQGEQTCRAATAELLEAFDTMSGGPDASTVYRQEIASLPYVDRAAEASMFGALREAKRQILRSLSAALPFAETALRADDECDNRDVEEPDEDADTSDASADSGGELLGALRRVREQRSELDAEALAGADLDLRLIGNVIDFVRRDPGSPEIAQQLSRAVDRYLAIRNRIIEANLPLALRYVRRFRRAPLDSDDIVQFANLGLIRAVERFDHLRGFRFMTFAQWWLRQAVSRAVADHGRTIRIPVHLQEVGRKVTGAARQIRYETGRGATAEELAAKLDLPVAKVRHIRKLSRTTIAIEQPAGPDGASRWADLLEDREAVQPIEALTGADMRRVLAGMLLQLPAREERVLRMRFGLVTGVENTLEEIGENFELTRERIRQIEAKAMRRLRHPSRTKTLVSMLGA